MVIAIPSNSHERGASHSKDLEARLDLRKVIVNNN
jgi:hypothetical protein